MLSTTTTITITDSTRSFNLEENYTPTINSINLSSTSTEVLDDIISKKSKKYLTPTSNTSSTSTTTTCSISPNTNAVIDSLSNRSITKFIRELNWIEEEEELEKMANKMAWFK